MILNNVLIKRCIAPGFLILDFEDNTIGKIQIKDFIIPLDKKSHVFIYMNYCTFADSRLDTVDIDDNTIIWHDSLITPTMTAEADITYNEPLFGLVDLKTRLLDLINTKTRLEMFETYGKGSTLPPNVIIPPPVEYPYGFYRDGSKDYFPNFYPSPSPTYPDNLTTPRPPQAY